MVSVQNSASKVQPRDVSHWSNVSTAWASSTSTSSMVS